MSSTDTNYLLFQDLSDLSTFFHCSAIIESVFFFVPLILLVTTFYRVFQLNDDLLIKDELSNSLELQPPLKNKMAFSQKIEVPGEQNQQEKIQEQNKEENNQNIDLEQIQLDEGTNNKNIKIQQYSFKSGCEKFTEKADYIIFYLVPLMFSIAILNILNYGCYENCVFWCLFWLFFVMIFNTPIALKCFSNPRLREIAEYLHLIIIIVLYGNYFINNQNVV